MIGIILIDLILWLIITTLVALTMIVAKICVKIIIDYINEPPTNIIGET